MATRNLKGRRLVPAKEFVPVFDADGVEVGSVPMHWGADQLPAGHSTKGPTASQSPAGHSTRKPAAEKSAKG